MFYESQRLGEYTLIEKLGRGGFGEVWLAEKEDELFAIKLPYKDQVDWKQITQEIGLWTLCGKHKNVLPLIGAQNFKGQIAIISEYAPDGSLEDLLRKKGKLSVEEAVEITIEILEGLQHLHESGIIHRDLKPANILLSDKTPRLTDFGISRIITADSLSDTISGTWAYMAPECFDGKRNVQTDIWSVGVILYRMLTGNLPFPQKEQTALVGSIIMHAPAPLSTLVPKLLCEIVMTTLNKKPSERYESVRAIRNELIDISSRMKFVYIPPGSFMMGSIKGSLRQQPEHKVTISEGYWIGETSVTQAQWQSKMDINPSNFKNCPNCPVEQVSWNDVQDFISKLNSQNDGFKYRLPFEAEWEYACRAGTTGDYAGNLDSMAWYRANSGNRTHPVATKEPNAWGLYDMHGNIWEWCQDFYEDYMAMDITDPTGAISGAGRVNRGGSYRLPASDVSSSIRDYNKPDKIFDCLGFRLIRQN